MRTRLRLLAVLAIANMAAPAAELERIRELLAPVRADPSAHADARGATSSFTEIKHLLRAWIEQRLAGGGGAEQMNRALDAADLFDRRPRSRDIFECCAGALGKIDILHPDSAPDYAAVISRLGILCGYDESVYLYQRGPAGWVRRLAIENNDYDAGKYTPQRVEKVAVSAAGMDGSRFVLTAGVNPWCMSNWQRIYYRLHRLSAAGEAVLIFDKQNEIYLGQDPVVRVAVTPTEATIEYSVASRDPAVHNRRKLEHYKLTADRAVRVAPFAGSARDFVEEWLGGTWPEAASLTAPRHRRALQAIHAETKGAIEFGQRFRCRSDARLWQVALRSDDVEYFFLVRERRPQDYLITAIMDEARAGCDIRPK